MLGISEPTMRTHLQRVFSKTGTSPASRPPAPFASFDAARSRLGPACLLIPQRRPFAGSTSTRPASSRARTLDAPPACQHDFNNNSRIIGSDDAVRAIGCLPLLIVNAGGGHANRCRFAAACFRFSRGKGEAKLAGFHHVGAARLTTTSGTSIFCSQNRHLIADPEGRLPHEANSSFGGQENARR